MISKGNYEYKNTKSIFGIKVIDNKKYFYKKVNNLEKEIEGFNEVNKYYTVPKIVACNNNEILFEYKDELQNKTIHEYLYSNKILKINYHKIFKQYEKSIKEFVIKKETIFRNSDFFLKRINILSTYISSNIFDKIHVFDNKEYLIKDILEEIKINLKEEKKIKGILTLGDPTDTNISVTGTFTDFECAGYNSVVGEIAILFISLTTHGSYFYPKYHSNAYIQRTKLLFNYQQNKQKIVYFNDPEDKCILLPEFSILKKNKKVLLKFLRFFNKHFKDDIEINKYLKYYVCMRVLSPIDITKMDEYDQKVIISLLIYFYENCNSIESLIEIVKKMKVKKYKGDKTV